MDTRPAIATDGTESDSLSASPRPGTPLRARPVTPAPSHPEPLEDRLRRALGANQFARYFSGQTRLAVSPDGVDVTAASDTLAKLIERRFAGRLAEAFATAPERVRVRVDRALASPVVRPTTPPSPRPVSLPSAIPVGPGITPGRFSLDDFVVGFSNRVAHAAASRMADEDQHAGPLFMHGPCGVGKTHLLQGLAARFLQRRPLAAVRYTTAEAFTNDYVAAVRNNRIDAFRKIYRKLDLLCLDDAHFLANKEGTQTELLHTFDAVGLCGARVALASDEHPRHIAKLNEKLVSRFLSGAVVRLDPPDPELRERLVRRLAQRRGLALEEAAASLIAQHGQGSVRELDGLLIQVEAVLRLLPEFSGTRVAGVIAVRKALGIADTATAPRPRRPLSIEAISGEVCRLLSVELGDLMGKGRHKRVVLARAVCVHLCRRYTTHSYPEIARGIGRPNHSTVITAHQRLSGQMETQGDLQPQPEVTIGLAPELRGLPLRPLVDALDQRIRDLATPRA